MLKNDIWIKEQANKGMITPFKSELVRGVCGKDDSCLPAISYGLSSYGYDIRLSPEEFLIFRHIPGTVGNPKAFDRDNLEPVPLQSDKYGDYFIIPANSYGLGVSLEKIQMPPNVTAICLGKSTYARCFTGSTKVKLVDGDYSFIELIKRAERGDQLYGYGVDKTGIVVQELIAPRYIEKSEIYRVTLDDGSCIDCTPDHKIMLRNGQYKEARLLTKGESLYPIYQHHSHGYPTIWDSVKADRCKSRAQAWTTVHQLAWDCLVKQGESAPLLKGWTIHHIDGDVTNNHPSNLEPLSRADHARRHNQEHSHHMMGGQAFREKYHGDPEFRKHINKGLHSPETKEKTRIATRKWKSSKECQDHLDRQRQKRWSTPSSRIRQSQVARDGVGATKRRNDVTKESVTAALLKAGTIRGAAQLLSVDRSAFRRFPDVIADFKNKRLQHNHKVVSVEPLGKEEDVYCLTAPDTGNFALSCGVFVSNCGIIANVTPLEASWTGHITLEFSNSSNIDWRIYANEGVVQLLFLEGEPCETTYSDRSGKYQGQTEKVTLPRV